MAGRLLQTRDGEFIRIKVHDDHLTVWIEGRDGTEPSVSGTSLTPEQLEELINMLLVYKINHFRGRDSSRRDRRQETRRQGDKTEKKLKELKPQYKALEEANQRAAKLVESVRVREDKDPYVICDCGRSGCYMCTED